MQTFQANSSSLPLGLGRAALGDDLHRSTRSSRSASRSWTSMPPIDLAQAGSQRASRRAARGRRGSACSACRRAPRARRRRSRARTAPRRTARRSASASARSTRRFRHDHAAEGRHRVARERALIGLERASAPTATPHGLLCLTITHAGTWNSASSSARGVEVEQVVERQLLAAELRDHREHVRPRADLRVVGAALVRVLAVGQLEHLLERAHQQRREVLALLLEPAGDRGVVAGRVGERLGRQDLARLQRQPPVGLAQLGEHRVVALGADDRRRERRSSWRPRGSSSGRRCRCSRSPRASVTPRLAAVRSNGYRLTQTRSTNSTSCSSAACDVRLVARTASRPA